MAQKKNSQNKKSQAKQKTKAKPAKKNKSKPNKKSPAKKDIGRPLKFKTVKQLEKLIDKYFNDCEENQEPYTITGLALALDTTRHTLIDYEERKEFLHTIRKAKARVENYAEKKLYSNHTIGAIFHLKNFGWADKIDVENSGKVEIVRIIDDIPKDAK